MVVVSATKSLRLTIHVWIELCVCMCVGMCVVVVVVVSPWNPSKVVLGVLAFAFMLSVYLFTSCRDALCYFTHCFYS